MPLAPGVAKLASSFKFDVTTDFGDIETVIQEGPFRKLTGRSRTTAGGNHGAEDGLQNEVSAVAMYFQRIFARVGVGVFHEGEQDFIEQLAGIRGDNIPVIKTPALEITQLFLWFEEQTGDVLRPGTTDADDPDAPRTERGGDGRYSIFQGDVNPYLPAR
jgi:hypothetical protein